MTLLLLALLGCGRTVDVVSVSDEDIDMSCGGDSEEPLADGFAAELLPDGCRYAVVAADGDGGVELLLDVPAFADAAAGESVSVTYTLPDEMVRLEVDVGCGLGPEECGEGGAEDGFVSRTYTPTSGTLSVTAVPDGDEADAVLVFTEVGLIDEYVNTTILDATWEVRLYGIE